MRPDNVEARDAVVVKCSCPVCPGHVEMVTFGSLDGSGSLARRFAHTLAVGLRTHGPDQCSAGMVFPLDEDMRGEIWIVSLGYQHVTN